MKESADSNMLASAVDAAPLGIVISDAEGTIVHFNTQAEAMFGFDRTEVIGSKIEVLLPEPARESHAVQREQFSTEESERLMGRGRDLLGRRKDGGTFPIEIGLSRIECDGEIRCVASIIDISVRRDAEQQAHMLQQDLQKANVELEAISISDPLTNALNRRGLERALWRELATDHPGKSLIAILLDLDDFKVVNDSLGHAVGDLILREVVMLFESIVRPIDHVARIGGDEFLVLLSVTDLREATLTAERLRLTVARHAFPVAEDDTRITVSAGVAPVPAALSSVEELLGLAQAALHRSKSSGKNHVALSDDVINAHEEDGTKAARNKVVAELLAGRGLYPVSQGIFSITGEHRAVGYELLSRCSINAFELPKDFFSLVREANVLAGVDIQCLRACMSVVNEMPDAQVFHVNIFPSTILATPIERLLKLLNSTAPKRVFVELSEQQFVGDPACLQLAVSRLRNSGIGIAVDDVGFGRSSLETLILLEPDSVKIDRRYVYQVAENRARRRALARLVSVIKSLGADAVAEGIETEADLAVVQDLGVEYGQGFFWGKPNRHELVD